MDLLDELTSLPLDLNPGLDGAAVRELARELGVPELPPDVGALYGACDGWRARSLPMRLMASAEAVALHRTLTRASDRYSRPFPIRYLWTDDGSDYAGVFVSGPLQGRVCWLAHDEPDATPRYRSTASFLASWREAHRLGLEWPEMPVDHPSTGPLDAAAREADRAAVRAAVEMLRSRLAPPAAQDSQERREQARSG